MQTIFFNGKVMTFDSTLEIAEAFLVNDESIVFVGSNEEVMGLKTDETALVNLGGKTIIPTFTDTNAKVFSLIEERLKNANNEIFIENLSEIDDNYEKFVNYEIYETEFLKIQSEYISNGITTIFEMGLTNKEFIFWKKISESGKLDIDVIGFVDIITSKDVMDNNCRSYRKYKNHFRLGGYLVKIDGNISEKKAFLLKKYRGEKTYKGFSFVHDEQLSFLIKSALDEKKQVVAEVNGDAALEQFIRCFEENVNGKEIDEMFRPIAKNCNLVSKSHLLKMKQLGISPSFEIDKIKTHNVQIKKILGFFRSKKFQPVADFENNSSHYLLNSVSNCVPNIFKLIFNSVNRNGENGKILSKKQQILFKNALFSIISHSNYLGFDDSFKGRISNGFRADFLVLDKSIDEIEKNQITDEIISEVYVLGKKIK